MFSCFTIMIVKTGKNEELDKETSVRGFIPRNRVRTAQTKPTVKLFSKNGHARQPQR